MKTVVHSRQTPGGAEAYIEVNGVTWACQITGLSGDLGFILELRRDGHPTRQCPDHRLISAALREYRGPRHSKQPLDLKPSTAKQG